MRVTFLQAALLVASTSFTTTTAQTWTHCNPLEKTCPDDPALAGTYLHTYGGAAIDFTTTGGKDVLKYDGPDGAIFRVEKKLDAPTIVSNFYIMWGRLEVVLKAAPGGGVVSSMVLQSDDLDEVDWEWIGSKPGEAQSNYFGKGNTDSYDRGAMHPVDSQSGFHTYAFDWTAEKLDWIIDGAIARTLRPADVKGDFYPQTPMQVRIGSWAAGDKDNEKGTVEWSGGPIQYDQGPFDMVVKSIKVVDYSTGTTYRYSDKSGSWKSIVAVGGTVGAGPQSGQGNTGKLATSAVSAAASDSTSRASSDGSKTGLLIPTTSFATRTAGNSEPTSNSGKGKGADSSESTQSSSSSSSGSSLGGSTTESSNASRMTAFFGSTGSMGGLAGLVIGWLLF